MRIRTASCFFHCAREGQKLDAIKTDDRVCFTVVARDDIAPQKLTTEFESVIAFGRAKVLEEFDDMLAEHIFFSNKYSSEFQQEINAEIAKGLKNMVMIEVDIEHMTGKQAIELVGR